TFSLSNGGTRTYSAVQPGNYSVSESSNLPTGWSFKSLSCTATGATSQSIGGAKATIGVTGQGTVDCTYTNHLNLSPSIGTTLSETSGSIGDAVHDSSKLTGATSNAGGTVTYTVYTDSACSTKYADAGKKTMS